MCNTLRLGSECVTDTGWLFHRFGEEGTQMFKNVYSLYSAFFTQPAFYSQSAVCILHSVCILPLVRSLQAAVRSLRFTLTAFVSEILHVRTGFLPHLLMVKYHVLSMKYFRRCHFVYTKVKEDFSFLWPPTYL